MAKSKSKKRKFAHSTSQPHSKSNGHHNNDENLTHEEIWDDSALQRSWDDAVAEYEIYHSIHAKGEDVDEVIEQYRAAAGLVTDGENDENDNEEGEIMEDGELDDGEEGEVDEADDPSNSTAASVNPVSTTLEGPLAQVESSSAVPVSAPVPAEPQTIHPVTQDQTLENIKMAYYWAGYYSGLYDGQRQATNQEPTTDG